MTLDGRLAAAREEVVREHMESENRHDFEAALATFDHPRYELVATGDTHDGVESVRRYYAETRSAFPDQRNQVLALHVSGEAVAVEFLLEGTHEGSFRGLPATGRSFACRMSALFEFVPGRDRIACERVYFDAGTILRQLGIAHDPLTLRGRVATVLSHPVTVGSALLRSVVRRRR